MRVTMSFNEMSPIPAMHAFFHGKKTVRKFKIQICKLIFHNFQKVEKFLHATKMSFPSGKCTISKKHSLKYYFSISAFIWTAIKVLS